MSSGGIRLATTRGGNVRLTMQTPQGEAIGDLTPEQATDIGAALLRFGASAGAKQPPLAAEERVGFLESEVQKLREGIRRFRVAYGRHLPESWAQHFDELVPPDPVWKAHDDARREALGGGE